MSTDASPERARESRRSGPLVGAVRWMENLSDTAYAYVLLIPVFLLLGAIALYPLLRTFELSLFETSLNQATQEFVGLSNYVEAVHRPEGPLAPGDLDVPAGGPELGAMVSSALVVTIIFAVVSVFFETIIGLGQALVLDQDFYGRRWVRAAIIIPWAVPIVIQG